MSKDIEKEREESKKSGRATLLIFVCFFLSFAAVDAFFVYKAITTHSGVVAENAYEIGLNFNDVIAEAEKRKNEHADGDSTGDSDQ